MMPPGGGEIGREFPESVVNFPGIFPHWTNSAGIRMAEASFTAPPASASSSMSLAPARDDVPPPVGVAANRPIGDSMGGNGVSSSRASFRPGDGRATSPGGSTRGRISVEKAQLGGGARLDLLRIKTKVERQMDETMPPRLKRFCQTDLCTNLLSSLLMYLVSHFLTEVAQRREAREKEQMEKGAGAFPDNTAGRKSSSEIAEERDYHLHCVGETYARVVVGNKDLSQDTQKERMFWEELLRFLNLAMAEAFVDQRHNAEAERTLLRVLASRVWGTRLGALFGIVRWHNPLRTNVLINERLLERGDCTSGIHC